MGKRKVVQQSESDTLKSAGEVDAKAAAVGSGGRKSKRIERGRVFINASYNNTIVTVTDEGGNVLAWASAGSLGFGGPKKATPFASSKVIAAVTERLKNTGPSTIDIWVKGVGGGRDSALRSLVNQGFTITSIRDVTPIPHNGPRPKKVRRV